MLKSSTRFKARIAKLQKSFMLEIEKLLTIWFDKQIQNNIPIRLLIIQKVGSIFETLKACKNQETHL